MPVGSIANFVHVFESRSKVLENPWVIGVFDSMLGANLTNFGSNVGVPTTTHSGKEMMLDLKIESASEVARNCASIRTGGLDLRLEPIDRLARLACFEGRIAVGIFKVVRKGKQGSQRDRFGHSHEHNMGKDC